MLKRKWYRWIRCLFGARSFTKTVNDETTYILVYSSRDNMNKFIERINLDAYVEEWPKEPNE